MLVLKRAVELDSASRFQESLICYQEGIDLLLRVLKGEASLSTRARCTSEILPLASAPAVLKDSIKTYLAVRWGQEYSHNSIHPS